VLQTEDHQPVLSSDVDDKQLLMILILTKLSEGDSYGLYFQYLISHCHNDRKNSTDIFTL